MDEAPPSAELIARAQALVRAYPQCFWFWRDDARLHSREDVRAVVRHLREHGGWDAWKAAQELSRCR